MRVIFVSLFLYFVSCWVSASALNYLAETNDDKYCPPKSLIQPCECDEAFGHIKCYGKNKYNISDVFARISNSNYSHFYDFFNWRIYETDGVIPDYIFGSCAVLDVQIESKLEENDIIEISPKAFVNFEGRNDLTSYVGLDLVTDLPHKDIINTVCSQISNLEFFDLRLKYWWTENPSQMFVKEDFAKCRNLKKFRQITIGIDGHGKNVVKYTLEPYFTDHLVKMVSLELDFPISAIKDYAFSRSSSSNDLIIMFEDVRIQDIFSKAFLGFNATKPILSLNTWAVLVKFPDAFSNFFDEADNNTVEIYGDTKARMNCDCDIQWLFERRHQIVIHDASSIDMFTCEDGTNFFNLTAKSFARCKPNYLKKVLIGTSCGIVATFVFCGTLYVLFRRQLKRYFRANYSMKTKPKGVCLIVNNVNFRPETHLSTRTGAEVDLRRLVEVFEKILLFEVVSMSDLTAQEMSDLFDQVRNRDDLAKHDAFICVAMSHGGMGDVIYGVDGNTINVHGITKMFNDQNCVPLRGKPKMFFVSACRGGKCTYRSLFLTSKLIFYTLILLFHTFLGHFIF